MLAPYITTMAWRQKHKLPSRWTSTNGSCDITFQSKGLPQSPAVPFLKNRQEAYRHKHYPTHNTKVHVCTNSRVYILDANRVSKYFNLKDCHYPWRRSTCLEKPIGNTVLPPQPIGDVIDLLSHQRKSLNLEVEMSFYEVSCQIWNQKNSSIRGIKSSERRKNHIPESPFMVGAYTLNKRPMSPTVTWVIYLLEIYIVMG